MAVQLDFVPSTAFYRFGSVLDGTPYIFDVYWNGRDGAWYFTLLDEFEDPIVSGVKVMLSVLLGSRTSDARFPSGGFIATDTAKDGLEATYDDLGTRVVVYYLTEDELNATL